MEVFKKMGLVVHKYGGTSVANVEKIKNVAQRVVRAKQAGNDVVVVLSAMAGETDKLIGLAQEAASDPDPREYDALIASGEQVTVALLSIVLNAMGYKARSFQGHQVRVHTDRAHTKARIVKVDTDAIRRELSRGRS
jgi:aspartate kinase